MGSLERRLRSLETQNIPEGERYRRAERELLRRLSSEELESITAPAERAVALVPCPRFEPRQCDCQCAAKRIRGLEEHPELAEEELKAMQDLYDRREEIYARDPGEVAR